MLDALLIMIIGMVGVFIFLLVLIGIMSLITKLAPFVAPAPAPARSTAANGGDGQTIAVIQAAIQTYEADKAR